jgi:hypothetical protein
MLTGINNTFGVTLGARGECPIILGDSARADNFYANALFQFWGEDLLGIADEDVKGDVSLVDGKLTLDLADKTIYWYKEGDLLKWHIALKKAPPANKYQLKLSNWDDYDFLFQPPLLGDIEEFTGGDGLVWIRPKGANEDVGGYSQRPLSINSSYAVYHKTKKGGGYATGKVLHIHRPFATDAEGRTAWLQLQIADGIYTATLPEEFAKIAAYPVAVNDTFGYTAVGGTELITGAYDGWGPYSGVSGTGNSVSIACRSSTAKKITPGLYSGASGDPDALVATCNDITCPATNPIVAFTSSNFQSAPTLEAGTTYHICSSRETTLAVAYDSDASYGLDSKSSHYVANTLDNPFGVSSETGTYRGSLYVTYTPSGGGANIKAAVHHLRQMAG